MTASLVVYSNLRTGILAIRLVRKLRRSFIVEYRTDEIHSQEVPFLPIPIPFAHDFERFDPGIDVFNDNTLLRQFMVQ